MLTLPRKISNNLTLCLKELEKEQTEYKVSKIKGIINNRAEIETRKTIFKRLTKLRVGSLKR